jgi:hypothetical protein
MCRERSVASRNSLEQEQCEESVASRSSLEQEQCEEVDGDAHAVAQLAMMMVMSMDVSFIHVSCLVCRCCVLCCVGRQQLHCPAAVCCRTSRYCDCANQSSSYFFPFPTRMQGASWLAVQWLPIDLIDVDSNLCSLARQQCSAFVRD